MGFRLMRCRISGYGWALVGLVLTSTCSAAEPLHFNRDIRPILSDKCFACHGNDKNKRSVDMRLDVRESAVTAGAIVPGKPDESAALERMLSDDPDMQMPPPHAKLGKLSPEEIQKIRQWIAEGAEYEPHWSFISLKPVTIPESAGLSPIDAIVAAGLARRGLTLQPEASKTALLRRVTFDLTGLPPTPAEVAAFLSDTSPEAYEKVVDRLLASEAYGERMTVDWLDISRYADSYGFQVDRERDVWAWRDWVIKAFNTNLPFDQFITWQIAGDMLPNATDEQILATAFNRLHQQETEGGSVEEEYRVEYVCDRVQTFATAFLGLTFECARCHDHKYDPITQKEYYGLFAMFQNIDEAGLYAYFTPSPPTPTLWLNDQSGKDRLRTLQEKITQLEQQGKSLRESRREAFTAWLNNRPQEVSLPGEVARFSFDAVDSGKLANAIAADKPATLGGNALVEGQTGQAIQFTGDDAVGTEFGNFPRHAPFTISLWMKTPDVKERAVVLHRSAAWTDAASRGYELLIIDGRLRWSLIHFWPGNAISIESMEQLPVQEWVHVVVSSDGSSRADGLRLLINGQPVSVDVLKDQLTKEITGGGNGGDNIRLGERFRDRGFTGGQVDDLRIFDRQLTPFESFTTYALESARTVLTTSPTELTEAVREQLYDYYLAAIDEEWKKHLAELTAARAEESQFAEGVREVMVMRELPEPKPAYVLFRGEYNQRREAVTAGIPAAVTPFDAGTPRNRLELAAWLTDRRHPLTARVTVNRFWQSLFGIGLVKTSEDFGSQGSQPEYAAVLDWLALRFIDSGWDTKALLKTIVMSRTYRQHSLADAQTMADDPENLWLARGPSFRLSAEMIRDNALVSSGLLKQQIGGGPVNPYEMSESFKPAQPSGGDGVYRRSLYTFWRRTGPPPAMIAFDAPRRAVCTAKRERTDSPLQPLILLNGIQYVEAARVLGEKLHQETNGDVAAMIQQGFLRCLSRPPDAREVEILTRLYREQLDYFTQHPTEADALLKIGTTARIADIPGPHAAAALVLAQALLNHDEAVVKR